MLRNPARVETALAKYSRPRFGRPGKIATAIPYLASDEAASVTGVSSPVDSGSAAV